jgi:hypothetical protein
MRGNSLQNLADRLAKARFVLLTNGAILGLLGVFVAGWLAPGSLGAKLAAAVAGVSLVAFSEFFRFLQRLPAEERGVPAGAGAACLAVCLLAAVGLMGYFIATRGQTTTPTRPTADRGSTAGEGTTTQGTAETSFSANEPDRLEIRPATPKRFKKVVVEVVKVWTLTPDKAPAGPFELPAALDIQLPVQAPFTDEYLLMGKFASRIDLRLGPHIPPETASGGGDVVDSGKGMVRRYTFTKQPKDYVFSLRVRLVDTTDQVTDAGTVIYLPDLRTSYNTPTSAGNLPVLREIQAMPGTRSQKLTKLLSDKPAPPEGKKP